MDKLKNLPNIFHKKKKTEGSNSTPSLSSSNDSSSSSSEDSNSKELSDAPKDENDVNDDQNNDNKTVGTKEEGTKTKEEGLTQQNQKKNTKTESIDDNEDLSDIDGNNEENKDEVNQPPSKNDKKKFSLPNLMKEPKKLKDKIFGNKGENGDEDDNNDEDEEEEIPENEKTNPEYDYLWKSKEAFDVENFASNFGAKRKWVDIFWAIIFWINFIVSFVLFMLTKPWESEQYQVKGGSISQSEMIKIGLICIGISFVICFLTYLFIMIAPRAYVKFSFIIIAILLWGTVIPLIIIVSPFFVILTLIIFVFCFFIMCKVCGHLNFSADVLKSAAVIIRHHPSTILFNLIMFIIQSGLSYIFSAGVILIYARAISYWVYVYVIISYFWIMQTCNYVTYATCAGVASTWYFLNETEHMPKFPIFWSFLHAIGPNFGACALAGLCEGISNAFRWIKKKGDVLTCGIGSCCFSCLKCCCNCFVTIVHFFIGIVDRYALIYCSMFGVPVREGVKRWKIAAKRKIVKQVVNSCVVGTTFGFYAYSSMAIGTCCGSLLALKFFGKGTAAFTFLSGIAGTFAFNGLMLISKPLEVMSDTLFIGFSEAPLRLETGAKEIYDIFKGKTKEMLDKEINAAKGIPEPSCWDVIKSFFSKKKTN